MLYVCAWHVCVKYYNCVGTYIHTVPSDARYNANAFETRLHAEANAFTRSDKRVYTFQEANAFTRSSERVYTREASA